MVFGDFSIKKLGGVQSYKRDKETDKMTEWRLTHWNNAH